MGLLSKASNLDFSKKLAFSEFINTHKLKNCAVLSYKNNEFFIENSIGFDAESIIASSSTTDFWNGVCKDLNNVYYFSKQDNSINCLLQFFSYRITENLEFISIYRIQNKILILLNNNITDKIISDFITLSDEIKSNFSLDVFNIPATSKIYKYEISLENSVESYETKAQLPIKNEISNRIINLYSKSSNAIRLSENKIRLFSIAPESFDGNSFSSHLKINLSEVIENNSNKINISFAGSSSDFNELELFMKVE